MLYSSELDSTYLYLWIVKEGEIMCKTHNHQEDQAVIFCICLLQTISKRWRAQTAIITASLNRAGRTLTKFNIHSCSQIINTERIWRGVLWNDVQAICGWRKRSKKWNWSNVQLIWKGKKCKLEISAQRLGDDHAKHKFNSNAHRGKLCKELSKIQKILQTFFWYTLGLDHWETCKQ